VKTDTVKKANKLAAIRNEYQKDNPNKQLYEGIEFGGETVKDEPQEAQSVVSEGPVAEGAVSETEERTIKNEKPKAVSRKAKSAMNQPQAQHLPPVPAAAPRVRKGFLPSSGAESPSFPGQSLSCVVLEDIQVQQGSIMNLLVLQEGVINGETIPKNTVIQAGVSFSSTAMNLSVSSIGGQSGNWSGYDVNAIKVLRLPV